MLKIGIIGAEDLGKAHIKCIKNIEYLKLVGFYESNELIAKEVEKQFKIKRFDNIEELVANADIVNITTPPHTHYETASYAIKNFRHIFLESPLSENIEEGKKLLELCEEAGVKIQIGHKERFNPAFASAKPHISNPLYIETARFSTPNSNNTNVSVVFDLMIHDIDIILSVVKSTIRKISANGISVFSDKTDMANARIEFTNGCVANLTANRITTSPVCKATIYQKNMIIGIDYLKETSEIQDLNTFQSDMPHKNGEIFNKKLKSKNYNILQLEIESFIESIVNEKESVVSIADAYNALDVANQINNKIILSNKLNN